MAKSKAKKGKGVKSDAGPRRSRRRKKRSAAAEALAKLRQHDADRRNSALQAAESEAVQFLRQKERAEAHVARAEQRVVEAIGEIDVRFPSLWAGLRSEGHQKGFVPADDSLLIRVLYADRLRGFPDRILRGTVRQLRYEDREAQDQLVVLWGLVRTKLVPAKKELARARKAVSLQS